MSRVRTNIEIEDTYVQAIMDRFGIRTKTEAGDLALRHLAGQPMTPRQALPMRGGHALLEVLAGARSDDREADLRRLLDRFALLRFDAGADFDGAVRLYRQCRSQGVTPRGLIDCMIAAVAWRRDASLLSHDADLARVATVAGIELDGGSLLPA